MTIKEVGIKENDRLTSKYTLAGGSAGMQVR
jgi:hypothetical protein